VHKVCKLGKIRNQCNCPDFDHFTVDVRECPWF